METSKGLDIFDEGGKGNKDNEKALKLQTENRSSVCVQMRWIE